MAATTTDRRKPSPFGLIAGSLAAFFALLAFLAVQVRAGGDPALGPPRPAATAESRRVIVHRMIVRRIVVTDRSSWRKDPGPDRLRLVARQPGERARRAGADHALGRRRARHGRQGVPEARTAAQADGAARARRARRPDRDRGARG